MMKTISINLTDYQHGYLERVARENRRKLSDIIYMMIETGGSCLSYKDLDCRVKKLESEKTEADSAQHELNSKLISDDYEGYENFWCLPDEKKKELGYREVCLEHLSQDQFRKIFESIGDLVIDTSPLEEK